MFTQDRDAMRAFIAEAWRKSRAATHMEPLEQQIAQIVAQHPEYHRLLEYPETALVREYLPENGETNPFLHLALHVAILEQVSTDRPAGIRPLYQRLLTLLGDPHDTEHRIMDCLAEAVWTVQRYGTPFDEASYIGCLEKIAASPRSFAKENRS